MDEFWARVVSEAAGRPVLVDLYPCQGGASKGYQDAGYFTVGVDLMPQPRYCGDVFVQSDAVSWLLSNVASVRKAVSFIHASPPCQRYSATQRIQGNDHPDLIGPTRDAMNAVGVPGVIENVEDARDELRAPFMLCGASFGLHTYRHRLFEPVGWAPSSLPEHALHNHRTVKMGRPVAPGDWYHAVGNFSGVPYIRRDLGVPWMSRDGIRECIPPVYATTVARMFRAALGL